MLFDPRDPEAIAEAVERLLADPAPFVERGFVRAPQFPAIPDTVCPFGYATVLVGSAGSAWTFGTSNLAGPPSNVGINFVDCLTLPERPQVA